MLDSKDVYWQSPDWRQYSTNKYMFSELESKLRAVEESETKLKLKVQTLETNTHNLR